MRKFLSAIYKAIPFKAGIFSLLKKIYTPPHFIYQHLHFKGIINVKVNATSSFKMQHYGYELENEVFWQGLQNGWEKVSINLWVKLITNSKLVFDVGANTGIYSLVAKAINPSAEVYAFEPIPWVFEKMKHNFLLNNYSVKEYDFALSDYTGTASIFLEEDQAHVYSVTVNKNMLEQSKPAVEKQIKTITLADVIEQNQIQHIDVLKIDVETHEAEVLRGMGKYLEQMKPTMLIEILNDKVGADVQDMLDGKGYLYYNIDENGGIRQTKNILQSDYYNYLVCSQTTAQKLELPIVKL